MVASCPNSFRRTGPSLDAVLRALEAEPHSVCLDDSEGQKIITFAGGDLVEGGVDYLARVRGLLQSVATVPEHPFSGGVMGFVSYEAGRFTERMPTPISETLIPEVGLRKFDGGMCLQGDEWWVAGTASFLDKADALLTAAEEVCPSGFQEGCLQAVPSRQDYLQAVEKSLCHIRAGDCYQVNVARRLDLNAPSNWVDAYLRLRALHPAPFGALLQDEGSWVLSNSPELFLRVSGDVVETAPIKGTRPRFSHLSEGVARVELEQSEKEKAELTMIVDMARNDLSRCCVPGSVTAGPRSLLDLPTLFHAEQRVSGRLSPRCDAIDAFAAAFPPASVTGAPKVKAMEIIRALEPVPRGVYTGAIGYFADGGNACFSVAIRTLSARGGQAHLHVGSGIVADSSPQQELEESGWKAAAFVQALTGARSLSGSSTSGGSSEPAY